ncbi:hypothetical protein SLS56_008217 [Neofusicoccum ribis]|uniref:SCP domain-containing protein n=1 Tax=Neofusicoccum ribis TaxID=45134 RepID=A0ABR3SKN5_9PEZI
MGGEPTTTIRHTSTITIVQTVYPSTEAAAVATGTASAATDEHSYTDDGVFKNTVLDVSNTVRQNYNASELAWNDTLADYAQSWSEGCKFEHSANARAGEQGGPYGENLAATYPSASAAITGWANESRQFNFADPDFSESTGHFSQMVWKSTTAIGCGRKNCGSASGSGDDDHANGWYVVCSYWPRGNVLGEFATNVDAAVDGSGSSWDDEGMIAKSKSGVGRVGVRRAVLGAQVLALVGFGIA